MSVIREEKRKKGKQSAFVNTVVKDFDKDIYPDINLFGDPLESSMTERFPHLIQLGNMHTDRDKFKNPQGTRVYSGMGTCQTLTLASDPMILIKDNGEYKVRKLSGVEEMRLMGVENEDIQKLVDGGISNSQLGLLAGNSIIVDVMSEMFKQLIKC